MEDGTYYISAGVYEHGGGRASREEKKQTKRNEKKIIHNPTGVLFFGDEFALSSVYIL